MGASSGYRTDWAVLPTSLNAFGLSASKVRLPPLPPVLLNCPSVPTLLSYSVIPDIGSPILGKIISKLLWGKKQFDGTRSM